MTLRELSKVSGISASTISLVLNNKAGISDKTREEVLNLVSKHKYKLPKKNSNTHIKERNILFLKYIEHGKIVEENAGFISSIIDTIEIECRKKFFGLSIVVCEHNLQDTLHRLNYSLYDGIIVLGTEFDKGDYSVLDAIPIPYIVIDNPMPNFDCTCISINNKLIAYKAVEYLYQRGHGKIGYLCSNKQIQNFKERAIGFKDACDEFGLEDIHKISLGPTLSESYQSMKKYIDDGNKIPECAFADNDTIAIGAMKALHEYGYKIPEDISIIGFDNIPFAEVSSPSLTTMEVPKKLIGKMALEFMCKRIDEKTSDNIKITVGAKIIVRGSTK